MIIRPHVRPCVLVVVLTVLVVPGFSAVPAGEQQSSTEDWYQLYTRARDDIKKEAFEEAEKKLLQARKSGPAQGPRILVRAGLIVPFSADYYLGEVYLRLGRAMEALSSFDSARKQNLNTRSGEFARLEEYRKTAATRWSDELIQTAKADVTKGDLANARKNAEGARALGQTGVDDLLADIKAAEASAGAKKLTAGGNAENVAPSIKDTLATTKPASEVTTLSAGGTPGGGSSGTAGTAKPDAAKDPAPPPPPDNDTAIESAGMRQFFSGDYQRAIVTLTQLNTPRALFYRACSRAGLALLSGSSNSTMLATAQQEYGRAVSGAVNFRRDEPYISPVILRSLRPRVEVGAMSPLVVGQGYFGGTDYRSANVASATECSALCAGEQACVAMTFIISTKVCFLKDRVPASAATPDMISAAKVVSRAK